MVAKAATSRPSVRASSKREASSSLNGSQTSRSPARPDQNPHDLRSSLRRPSSEGQHIKNPSSARRRSTKISSFSSSCAPSTRIFRPCQCKANGATCADRGSTDHRPSPVRRRPFLPFVDEMFAFVLSRSPSSRSPPDRRFAMPDRPRWRLPLCAPALTSLRKCARAVFASSMSPPLDGRCAVFCCSACATPSFAIWPSSCALIQRAHTADQFCRQTPSGLRLHRRASA